MQQYIGRVSGLNECKPDYMISISVSFFCFVYSHHKAWLFRSFLCSSGNGTSKSCAELFFQHRFIGSLLHFSSCPFARTNHVSPAQLAHANFSAAAGMWMDVCGRCSNESLAEVENNLVREESVPPASLGPLAQFGRASHAVGRQAVEFCSGVTLNLPSSLRWTWLSFSFFFLYCRW